MKKRAPNKCGSCGESGHNAKTCSRAATRAAAPADPEYRGSGRVRVLKPGVSGEDLAREAGLDPVALRREPPRKLAHKPERVARALQPARLLSVWVGPS